jgi:hypothetical protein
MRALRVIALFGLSFGTGLGVALGGSPLASADPDPGAIAVTPDPAPISVWPQDYFSLDGAADGAPTNVVNYLPDGWGTTEDQSFTNYFPGAGEYSAHLNLSNIPDVENSEYQQVFASTGAAPADGSFSDTVQSLYGPIPSISGDVPYFTNSYIDLQGFGTGDETIFAPLSFVNQFVSDSAGVEDVASFFGQQFTLFDIPFADAGAGAATDLSQLATEFTSLF